MLIICSECGKQYSDQAESCPHCGAKTSQNRYLQHSAKRNYERKSGSNTYSIGSITCSVVSLFIYPYILGIIGVILGIIGVSKQEEKVNLALGGIIMGIFSVLYAFYTYTNII